MTCIVGVRAHSGKVFIGGDSAGVAGHDLMIRANEKVFVNGPYLIGFCDSFRMGQLLRYSLQPPAPRGDLPRFMSTTFINAVRTCLKAGGFAQKDDNVERGGTFLAGVRGRLFLIDDDFQVGEPHDGYAAIGCGDQIAHGSLYATCLMADQSTRVLMALQAAEHFSAGVRGPFKILSQ